MRAVLECISKFPGSCCAQMNSSVRTCAGLFITQHLKVSYFLSVSSRADAHDELSKTGEKITIGPLFSASPKDALVVTAS